MSGIIFDKTSGDLDGSNETVLKYFSEKDTLYTIQIVNNLDAQVTVTAKRTHRGDSDLSDGVDSVSETVSANSNSGMSIVSDAWEAYGLDIAFGSNPSSGSLTLREHTK